MSKKIFTLVIPPFAMSMLLVGILSIYGNQHISIKGGKAIFLYMVEEGNLVRDTYGYFDKVW